MFKRDKVNGWGFVSPALILLLIFTLGSSFYALYLSFNSVNLFSGENTFVGFDNYIRLFSDPKVKIAFRNALVFAAFVVPTQTIISLVMAVVLSNKIKFKKTFRLIFFLPTLTSSAALTLIFMFIFSTTGPINEIGLSLGLIDAPINFLKDSDFALKVIMIMNIWSTVPVYMTIYFAAICDIPKSMYEAADIDSAGTLTKFFKITLPQVRNVTSYVLLVGIIGTIQMFDQAFIFSDGSGGPENSTLTPALLIYQNAFGTLNSMGYAAAIAVVLAFLIFVISTISNKITKSDKGVDS